MPLYRLTPDHLAPVAPVTYAEARLTERDDLQRLLRDQIDVLDPELLVIAEEFEDWDDSARRIDLLAVDRQANLVVVELKVTADAGHADLQALRYAAMVSTITFDQAVDAHARYLARRGLAGDARGRLLHFLGWPSPDGQRFAPDVRIVLVAPGFSKELTTAVLWLRDRRIDVRCVRATPHRADDGVLLLDVAQIIPLPEAAEYQVRVSHKAQEERAGDGVRPDLGVMRRRVEESAPPHARAAVAAIVDRLAAPDARWVANKDSIALAVDGPGGPQYLCAFRVGRGFELWFRWLSTRGPFADEARRAELLARLGRVPGVDVSAHRTAGFPSVPFEALATTGAVDGVCAACEWAAGVIRRAA